MNLAIKVGGLTLVAALVGGGVLASPAVAQQMQIRATFGGLSGPGGGQISKRSVERYAELLGLSSEQRESALAIHEGYAAAYQDAQKTRRTAMDELRRSSDDTGDNTVFMEKMPAIEGAFREKTQKLEKGLFDDLKGLAANPAQEARWPKVERMHRREVWLRRGALSGESVDLIDVVGGMRLPPEVMSALAPALDEYEAELDHQLQAKARLEPDSPAFVPGKPLDPEKMKKQMDESRDAGLKVKEVNERSERKIEPLLPEDKRAAFRDAVRQRSFPQVYRPSRSVRDMDAALKLDDLSASQRASIAQMKAGYEHDVAPLNDAWASAITASEADGSGGVMMTPDGGRIMLNMGDDPPALVSARKARRELDDKMAEKLKGILSEPQQAKVASTRAADTEDDMGGAVRAIMITDDKR